MTKPGRPNHHEEDIPFLISMAEDWRAGKAGYFSRKLSRVAVGLDALSDFEQSLGTRPLIDQKSARISGKGTPESKAKRLERAFNKLKRDGIALPISVYLNHNAERHSVWKRQYGPVVGPFSEIWLQKN
jgi:hypothetical protein